MGLEVATTINQLVPTNPLGSDARQQGDDHIRLIKSALKNTFTAVAGPVTVSHDQLNAIGIPGNINFPGMIVMWSGTLASIPAGWKLCDGTGTISNGNAVPNLKDRFIIGATTEAGGTYNIGSTGGAATHTHTGTIGDTTLTIDQIPSHSHALTMGLNDVDSGNFGGGRANSYGTQYTKEAGGGKPHTHSATIASVSNLPPYFALAFIIKN